MRTVLACLGLLSASVVAAECAPPDLRLENGAVWDGQRFVERSVFIRDGRITDRPPATSASARDVQGLLLIPGLIDSHAHIHETGGPRTMAWEELPPEERSRRILAAYLASGVTTARIHLSDGAPTAAIRDRVASPCVASPRLLVGGRAVFGGRPELDGRQVQGLPDVDAAGAVIDAARDGGSGWLALHGLPDFQDSELIALRAAATAGGIRLMGEGSGAAAVQRAIDHRLDSIEYLAEDGLLPPDILAQLARPKAPFVVAPIGFYRRIARAMAVDSPVRALGRPAYLQPHEDESFTAVFDAWIAADGYYADAPEIYASREANFLALVEHGAQVLPGTDVGSAGQYHEQAIWTELTTWADLGVPISRVLNAATMEAAGALGLDDDGPFAPGSVADLVVVDAEREGDLSTWSVRAVIKAGRWYERVELLAIARGAGAESVGRVD